MLFLNCKNCTYMYLYKTCLYYLVFLSPFLSLKFSLFLRIPCIMYTTNYDHISFFQLPSYSPQHILHSTSSLLWYEYFIFNTPSSPVSVAHMFVDVGLPLRHGILVVATSLKLHDSLFPNN